MKLADYWEREPVAPRVAERLVLLVYDGAGIGERAAKARVVGCRLRDEPCVLGDVSGVQRELEGDHGVVLSVPPSGLVGVGERDDGEGFSARHDRDDEQRSNS